MRKVSVIFIIAAMLIILPGCNGGMTPWRGYENEDLTNYITIGEYKQLGYKQSCVEITDKDIDDEIQQRLENITVLEKTELPISERSTVCFDRYAFISGVSTPSISEENGIYSLDIEYEDSVINLLLSKMKGLKEGDTAVYTVNVPSGYAGNGSTACEVEYRITVRAVYVKNVPKLDDVTAGKIISGCKDVKSCRDAIKAELEKKAQKAAESEIRSGLWQKVIQNSVLLNTPYEVYERTYAGRYSVYEELAKAASLSVKEYAEKYLGSSESELESKINERTLEDIKEEFAVYMISENEGITVSDDDIEKYAERCCLESDGAFNTAKEYIAYYGKDSVKTGCLKEKVIDFIVKNAVKN